MSRIRSAVVKSRPYLASVGFGALLGVVLFAISFAAQQRRTWAAQATWPEIAYGTAILVTCLLASILGENPRPKRVLRAMLVASAALLTIHGIPYIADSLRGNFWYPLLSVSLTAFVEIVIMSGIGAFLLALVPGTRPLRMVTQVIAVTLFVGALTTWHWRATKSGEIAKEEYEVYSAVLEQSFPNGCRAVLSDNTTIPAQSLSRYHPAAASLLAPFAVVDFEARNVREFPLQPALIRLSNGVLISRAQYRKTSQDDRRIDALYDAYPSGVLWFSRVGFDPVSRTAVVFMGNQFGSLGGEGDVIVLSKLSGKWKIQQRIPQWFI